MYYFFNIHRSHYLRVFCYFLAKKTTAILRKFAHALYTINR